MTSESEVDIDILSKEAIRVKNPSSTAHLSLLSQQTILRICSRLITSGILDDCDAQIITESFAVVPFRKSSLWKVPALVSVSCLISWIVCVNRISVLLFTLSCLAILFILLWALDLFAIQFVSYYVRSANDFDAAVRQVFSVIHFAEITTFGLTKKSSIGQQTCMRSLRVEFVDVLRAVVHSERCASDSLCRDDEKESLLWAALTPEMAELANNGPINEEFIKLPALKELWQLYFLLRSEFIRLLFMTLLESSIMGTFSLFSRWYGQAREMISYSKKLNAVSRFIGQQKFSNDPENKKRILPTMEPFDRARVQLQIASDLLSSKKADSDVSDVVRILSEVIKALNSGSQDTQPDMVQQVDGVSVGHESFMRENDDREFAVAAASNVPSAANVDQMFEAVSHPDVTPLSYSSSFFDSVSKEVTETARSLVNELESALEDRKREMKKRERIALARFYGNPHEFEDTSDPRFANATDSDDSEPISRSTVSSIHNSEDTEASTHKQSSQKSSNSDEGNLSENPEAKRNSIPHRYTASAWGTGLSDALRIRSALPQQHFGDTDSADSEHDTVSTQE